MRFWLPLLFAAILPAAPRIVGGPVVVNVTGRSAMVVWVVQTDQLTVRSPTGAAKQSPSLHVERTTLTGLQPNTRYEYDAGGPGGVKGSFKTAPLVPGTTTPTTTGTQATTAPASTTP